MIFTGERYVPATMDDDEIKIEHIQRYQSIQHLVPGKIILDAACGEGYGTDMIAKDAHQIYGIDIDKVTIEHAQKQYIKANLEFLVGSIEKLPFEDGFFDIVVSFETIEHVDEKIQNAFLKEIKRVLKEDGLLIISTPNKEIYSDYRNYSNPYHVKEFYKGEFFTFLNTKFKNVEFFYQARENTFLLSGENNEDYKNLELENTIADNSKYIIAICSDLENQNLNLNSIIVENGTFNKKIERIIELQEQVEDRNRHIEFLDQEILEKNKYIINLQKENEFSQINNGDILDLQEKLMKAELDFSYLSGMFENFKNENYQFKLKENLLKEDYFQLKLESEIAQKEILLLKTEVQSIKEENFQIVSLIQEIIREESINRDEIAERVNKHEELQHTRYDELIQKNESSSIEIDNLKNENEQLKVQERLLNNIYESDGWKILSKYYKVRDKMLPSNSKVNFTLKMFKKVFIDRNFHLINKGNFKKFKYHYKNNELTILENKVDTYIERNTNTADSYQLELIDIQENYKLLVFEKSKIPKVSIIIPVFNQWNYTYVCLKSILEHTENVTYEIILADDMSTDETVNADKYAENIKIVRDGENRGFLLNCNNAAQYAEGEYIFFLNNDTQVQPGWLDSLVELIESNDQIGMVGSKLVYPDGRLQEAGGVIWNDASGWNYGRLDDPAKPEYNYVKEVDYISGAAIMIRKDLWNIIGGFDERYVPAYYEDTDLAFGVRKHGYKVMLQPKSVVIHFEGISHGKDLSGNIKSYQVKNKEIFAEKWKEELSDFHLANAKDPFKTRDRSQRSKVILVVDHYVPHYDKDAGGRCTYQYLKLFKSLGHKVVFLGDNFYKHEPYTSELQQLGIEVLYGNEYAKNINQWIKKNGQYFDFVYFNRPHITKKYINHVKGNTNAKIIYFGHDLHYLRELRNYEIEKNPALLKSSEEWKAVEFDLFSKADVVHVVGAYEQGLLQKEFPNKSIRNIPLFMFEDNGVNELYQDFNSRDNILFVGGFGHKPNYDGVWWFVNEVWPLIVKQNPIIKFYIVGSNPPDDILALNSEKIIVTGFVTDEQLEQYYHNCKVVVVPLRYGAGVKGKVVEAISYHVPIVTTSIGAEGLVKFDNHARISDNSVEFASMVTELYSNAELWSELSLKSEAYINRYFTFEAAIEQIELDIK